jgi:tungstate transport system substrate-binding protein
MRRYVTTPRRRTPRRAGGGAGLPRLSRALLARLADGSSPLRRRHLAILEAVRDRGSLNAAAQHLGISYRNTWTTLRQLQALLGVGLIRAQTGGRNGGGSRLTVAGEEFVARLRAFLAEQRAAAAHAASRHFGAAAASAAARDRLRLATTTSVVDSGLLAVLLPPFTDRLGIAVEVLPVGSGAALRLARDGRADAVLAHAPAVEERAESAGAILNRRPLMTNQFVLLGPADDPARVRGAATPAAAVRRIAAARAVFFSRADRSGTHECERHLLRAAAVTPGRWHRQGRCGMAELLRRASAAQAYLLSDTGTFAALADGLALEILANGAARLGNQYSIAAANPHRQRGVRFVEAMALIGWLTSPAARELIAEFRVGGRRIAVPMRGW